MYEAYFGLAQLPFCIAPDLDFYVETASHRAAIQALKDRLQRGDEFVALVGDHGAGKTMVGRQLLQEMDRQLHLAAELPRLRTEGDQLFDRIAEAFGMRRGGGLPPLGSLVRKLEDLVYTGRDALLLVDDAHRLDSAILRRLRKLTAIRVEGRAALRVCLVGHSMPLDFEATQPAGRRMNFGTPVRVGSIDAADTHQYILTRLGFVGWWGRPAFDAATEAIHGRCDGNPVRINRLCDHILLHLYTQGLDRVTPEIVHVVDESLNAGLHVDLRLDVCEDVYVEPVTIELPLVATPEPLATPEAPAAGPAWARLDGDALMSRLIGKPLPGLRAHDSGFSVPPAPAPDPDPAPPAGSGSAKPRRPGMAQGVAALALLAGGGVAWQMIPNTSAHGAVTQQMAQQGPTEIAPQATAAGLAVMAEQAIAQSPTGAGATLQYAPAPRLLSASLSPASGPRSSPPAR